jgi:hypothetical protein
MFPYVNGSWVMWCEVMIDGNVTCGVERLEIDAIRTALKLAEK